MTTPAPRQRACALAAWLLLAGGAHVQVHAEDAAPAEPPAAASPALAALTGELRLRRDARQANADGPLAEAQRRRPGISPPTPDDSVAEAGLRGQWSAAGATLQADVLAWTQRDDGQGGHSHGRVNELHLGTERGAWALSAGKKVLGWDVGYGFRPNDMVQQEQRRTLLDSRLEGRPLLQLEHFGQDSAAALVWVNPQHLQRSLAGAPGADESALAAHGYWRSGSTDAHAFARTGRHSGASLGAAVAQVSGDALEWHASWRWLQRHEAWAWAPAAGAAANPWQRRLQGDATQWLLGAQWTGSLQQSLLVEWWHDGAALSDAQWSAWGRQTSDLRGANDPAADPQAGAQAGALAWQATPFNSPSLRRDNLFVRAAWQPGRWTLSLDALRQPRDGGVSLTAGAQWQGERWRLNAALRRYLGPHDALLRQLPQRQQAVLAATWSF